MSSSGENSVPAAGLLVVLVVAAAIAVWGYYSTNQTSSQPRTLIALLQLQSTSVAVTGLRSSYLSLDLDAVVRNPTDFGATVDAANYSVFANGRYLGSGQIHGYELAPKSSQTFIFPINVGWRPALETTGSYVLNLGAISWRVNGTAAVDFGGVSLSLPFTFTAG